MRGLPEGADAGVTETPRVVLTIAGFDPSSGAGITADLQVFAAHGLFGVSAITALTVQSTRGVRGVEAVSARTLRATLEELWCDFPVAGVKLGMLAAAELVGEVARFLGEFNQEMRVPVVCDPVLRSSSGSPLLSGEALELLRGLLLKHASWVTPNWSELALLTGLPVETIDEAEGAASTLGQRYAGLNVVATGGDAEQPVDVLRLATGEVFRIAGERVETTSTHGTGCGFSSALLSRLVQGHGPLEAVTAAKRYVEGALLHAPGLGHGRGPMGLLWPLRDAARG